MLHRPRLPFSLDFVVGCHPEHEGERKRWLDENLWPQRLQIKPYKNLAISLACRRVLEVQTKNITISLCFLTVALNSPLFPGSSFYLHLHRLYLHLNRWLLLCTRYWFLKLNLNLYVFTYTLMFDSLLNLQFPTSSLLYKNRMSYQIGY